MNTRIFALLIIAVFIASSATPLLAFAKEEPEKLIVMEMLENNQTAVTVYSSTTDLNGDTYYQLTGYQYTGSGTALTTAKYYINTNNKQGLSATSITGTIQASANTWDDNTAFEVFSYQTTTTRTAGKRDGYNVVDFGTYRKGAIAVTMFWVRGSSMVEIDMRMNTLYKWSFSGEAGKMDVQNIATHEFGHWAGLNDVYATAHSWLTMYGYSDYGVTYQQTLCSGDVAGLIDVYGA